MFSEATQRWLPHQLSAEGAPRIWADVLLADATRSLRVARVGQRCERDRFTEIAVMLHATRCRDTGDARGSHVE